MWDAFPNESQSLNQSMADYAGNLTNLNEPYCGATWNATQEIITKYIYGSVILVLETIGTPFSILTVIIFAKNSLSPSKILFTSLAISDLMVLLLGIPQLAFRMRHHHVHYKLDRGSYTDVEKYADHYLCTGQKIFYNISLYQTMLLAIWRYIAITHPLKERIWCSVKMTFIGVVIVYILCFLYFTPVLMRVPETTETNDKLSEDHIMYHLFYIIILKVIPCIIVSICTVKFICVLLESKKRRKEMIPNFKGDLDEKEKQMNRTTKMVLGITIFFLTNNTGLTIGRILIVIFRAPFEKDCSPAIICVNNLLVLIYTVIPFVVYYGTSQQFRESFRSLLPTKICISSKDKNMITDGVDLEISNVTTVSIISMK